MADANRTADQQHAHEGHAPYLTIFFILLNYTTLEYLYASFYESWSRPLLMIAAALLINVATGAAALALHFPFNRRWVYLTLVPALLLGFFQVGLVLGLMTLAVIKAGLVGLYFMHLKYEGRWVYYMLIPAAFLASVFIFALWPDIGLQPGSDEELDDESPVMAPAYPPTNPAPIR